MAADESALVPVLPDDTIDSIVTKVRGTGASNVQLLVPDDTPALQALGGFERLRGALDHDHVGLLVISSDEKTLNAARLNKLDTVGVEGARVRLPAPGNGGTTSRYTTQVLPKAEPGQPAVPIDDRDAAFLDALDHVPARDRYADLDSEDADLYAALDDLSDTMQHSKPARHQTSSADDDFAAALDEWSDLGETDRAPADTSAAPKRRVSAADIDLSDDDLRRQRGGRRTTAQRERADSRATPVRGATARRQRSAATGRMLDLEDERELAPRRSSLASRLLPILLILLIVTVGLLLYFRNRTTVTIQPAASSGSEYPFTGEAIGITSSGPNASAAMVQAAPVSADAAFTVQSQVTSETMTPTGVAKGVVTIVNTVENPVPLAKDTEFIGQNANGAEVRFTLDADAVVPPAVTSTSLTGRSTTYGQIDVGVTARSPGSASNVGENSIKQILIPGQQPIISDSSNFLIRHPPITGGSEQPVRIVTNADVERVLGEALTGLYNTGVQELRSAVDEQKFGIDPTTISPSAEALGDPKSYDPPVVEPPVGQPVDANNPVFKVTVQTHFSGLATPRDNPVSTQLNTVVPNHFMQRTPPPCKANEIQAPSVTNWHWDGITRRLTIDGKVACLPAQWMAPEIESKVKNAVQGKSREEAEAGLQGLVLAGDIGGYQLPEDLTRLPPFGWLIDVQTMQPLPQQSTPRTP